MRMFQIDEGERCSWDELAAVNDPETMEEIADTPRSPDTCRALVSTVATADDIITGRGEWVGIYGAGFVARMLPPRGLGPYLGTRFAPRDLPRETPQAEDDVCPVCLGTSEGNTCCPP